MRGGKSLRERLEGLLGRRVLEWDEAVHDALDELEKQRAIVHGLIQGRAELSEELSEERARELAESEERRGLR